MKHVLKVLFLVFLSVSVLFAEEEYKIDGFYIGAVSGVNFRNPDYHKKVYPGFLVGAYSGYKFYNNLRLEGELAFRRNEIKRTNRLHKGYDSTLSCMANLIYDFNLCSKWTPFLGMGLGYAYNDLKVGLPISPSFLGGQVTYFRRSHDFAYQGIVGIAYRITSKIDLDLQYRYMHTGVSLDNSILLSIKKFF